MLNKVKALDFATKLGLTDFVASNGRLRENILFNPFSTTLPIYRQCCSGEKYDTADILAFVRSVTKASDSCF